MAVVSPSVDEQLAVGAVDSNLVDAYDPGLYRFTGVATTIAGFGALDAAPEEQADFYDYFGYLAIEGAFTADEVQRSLQGILKLIDGKYPGYRGVQFEARARERLASLTPEEKQDVVRKVSHFHEVDSDLRAMAFHPKLLATVTRLLGEAPALFESKALLKPPLIGREKPWHQDHAYFNLPLGTRVVTAWIALDPALVDNGCLLVIPGSQREGPVVHFRRRDWQICDEHVQVGRAVAAPLSPGGCLLFDGLLHHGSPTNESRERRRSLQFVYIPASAARISPEERMAVFGSEGKDVSC